MFCVRLRIAGVGGDRQAFDHPGTNEVFMKRIILLFVLMFALNGCLVGAAVGTAVDVGIEVVKVPFKVGGAIYDGVTGDDEEDDSGDLEEKD